LKVLEYARDNYPNNFWVYHRIARMYQKAGRNDDCINAFRKAHCLIGWEESERNGYSFLQDYFSSNIPVWSKWFAETITVAPIDVLEIGSWQGGSATWLLDKIISRRGGRLTCIDTFEGSSEHASWIGGIGDRIEDIFDRNIAASGHSAQCRKIIGFSQAVLRRLHEERFDFIYIDGAHEARYVIEDAVLAFGLLKDGGYICFDDYDFSFAHKPRQNTRRAIDIFLDLYDDEISYVEKTRQVLLRKGTLPVEPGQIEHTLPTMESAKG
jgi:predicted O-methyltransferase YrrM